MYKATSGFSHTVSAVHPPPFAATTRSARTGWSSPETITTFPWTTGVTAFCVRDHARPERGPAASKSRTAIGTWSSPATALARGTPVDGQNIQK
jgi:hypothetical protein